MEKRARRGPVYNTPGSKGKAYQRVDSNRKETAGRGKSYLGAARPEINTFRTNFPGAAELRSLSIGTLEEQDAIYKQEQVEEQTLLEVNSSVKLLLESLGTKITENDNEE
jgi:hypothetical protein